MKDLTKAIKSLNSQSGKGDVSDIRLYLSGKGTFVQKPYGCKGTTKHFSIYQNAGKRRVTVFALRHQMTFVY